MGQALHASGQDLNTANGLAVSPDGSRVFVTGSVPRGLAYDYGTVAYDAATGTQLWAVNYDGPAKSYDDAATLGVSPDGSEVFVTGYSIGSGTSHDYATLAYDASTGAQLWVMRYDGPISGTDLATDLAVSPTALRCS